MLVHGCSRKIVFPFTEKHYARMPHTSCCVSASVCLICECTGEHIGRRSGAVPETKRTSSVVATHRHTLTGVGSSSVPSAQSVPFPALSPSPHLEPSLARAHCPKQGKCTDEIMVSFHPSPLLRTPLTNAFTILMSSMLMSMTSTPH